MSSAVAARLLGNERGVSKSPAPESAPGSPGKVASPAKSPLGPPASPGSKRKAEDEGAEEAKRVKLEPGADPVEEAPAIAQAVEAAEVVTPAPAAPAEADPAVKVESEAAA